ncbi:hypothetical protein H310_02237 [Aphanomyces invadans]|uniref:Enoyl-CoA delta isomerase 1, mitochondrial n=1 Tax=Aphanomyces invadans TaxID=157072 RepID=A0A024UQ85_9STRA|nr:hypothetical protein H310_02237 [Aphanomyces invadans]ETW07808.1 hypothetical protein H310_02237 [Aphanomyces invadans]|eukprot:XP_008863901.1 hypothetical protein H310_02237 [Aphanomyces invadans]
MMQSARTLRRCGQGGAFSRWMSTSAIPSANPLVNVERREGFAIVRLNRPPVNSLNLEMFQALDKTVEELEKDKTIKGMILASANPKIFSGGLDITELYQPKNHRLREFWGSFQRFFLRLYMSPLATVAAVEGHSPAGGCFLAMCCDARVMAIGKPVMGLNETKLGIAAPFWMKDVMLNTIGHRETEKMLGLGLQVDAINAKRIGLVDEAVELDEVLPVAESILQQWLAIPGHARKATKHLMRHATAERLRSDLKGDVDNFADFIETDRVQNALGAYLESLKKSKESKQSKA